MKVSSKKINLHALQAFQSTVIKAFNGENSRVLLLTSTGIVTGVFNVLPTDDIDIENSIQSMIDNKAIDFSVIRQIKRNLIKNSDAELTGDGSTIFLKEVKIYASGFEGSVIVLQDLILHCDDIIGMSILPSGTEY